jgi:hypothetical protein
VLIEYLQRASILENIQVPEEVRARVIEWLPQHRKAQYQKLEHYLIKQTLEAGTIEKTFLVIMPICRILQVLAVVMKRNLEEEFLKREKMR